MLRVLGNKSTACDGLNRREAMQVGGLSLFSGLTLPNLLSADDRGLGRAKSVILVNLFGGPPHMDMFDLKPNAPEETRGEMKSTSTSVPGLQICDLMPQIATIMDRATLIRTYSHRYNSHNPYNVLTGFDGGSDRDNYFSKVTDHPGIGTVCQYFGMGRDDIAPYVMMPAFPGYSQALRRAGPYGGYLGPGFDPLFTQIEPTLAKEGLEGDYEPTIASGVPTPPSVAELPDLTVDRLSERKTLLQQIDSGLSAIEKRGPVQRMGKFRDRAFQLLTSTKTRSAFDIDQEDTETRDRYGSHIWGNSALIARRLVEAGCRVVTLNFGRWDFHSNNFKELKNKYLPLWDQGVTALVEDLHERGLDSDVSFVAWGEFGRTPKINKNAGRDHWPQVGGALLAGGGMRAGQVIGSTDRLGEGPKDRPVHFGEVVSTLYHNMGINAPISTVKDLQGRPHYLVDGHQPMKELV